MQIRFKTGPNKGKAVAITGTEPIIIGRENHCGLQIIDRGVSREHARVVRVGEMVFLHDMGSRNGSYVNGERVKEELLREGDLIRVGATQLVFESKKNERKDGIQYDEDDTFKSSLELNVNDLYVIESDGVARESEHFKAICRVTNLVQIERDEKSLYGKLLDAVFEYIPASHIYIFIRDEQTGTVAPAAIKRKPDAHSAPISRLILRKVINESKAILTADAMQDERFKSGESIISKNIRSLICAPVAAAGHVHGAIYAVNSSLTEAFDQSDLQLVSAVGSQLALAVENLHLTVRRRKVYFRIIGRMLAALEGAPMGAPGHAERVSEYCAAIASGMGQSEREIVAVSLGGLLHEIGAQAPLTRHLPVSDLVQAKASAAELAALNAGLKLLEDIPDLSTAMDCVRAKHERFDGTGIPGALAGEKIPLGGRIIAAACAFDRTVYPDRSKKEADGTAVRKAFEDIERRAGTEFDPEVVKAMMVAYRSGTLMGVKSGSVRVPEVEMELPEPVSPQEASESLRKELGAMSRLNTVRMSKDGKTDTAKE